MRVSALRLRNFRGYAGAELAIGPALTVVSGRNGAGKTNLLEGLYFGCTGRSCRTANEREVVRFGMRVTRVEVDGADDEGFPHTLAVGFEPGRPKRLIADGAPVEHLLDVPARPLVSIFLPDRLELVKGTPAVRRGHLDQVVAALWPARTATRRAYAQALAQRNALLSRVRAGAASRGSLPAWDLELARHGIALMADRDAAVRALVGPFAARAAELGLDGDPELRYRPRSRARGAAELAVELSDRLDADLERGFTRHGPHRDELVLLRNGRELRAYGSQGEQRLALLALLLAEREAISAARGRSPLLLLDDVMSELDADRLRCLVDAITGNGQVMITTTDPAQVPGADGADVCRVAVRDGTVLRSAVGGGAAPAAAAG
jgi:DNA replication and repair protein RecF